MSAVRWSATLIPTVILGVAYAISRRDDRNRFEKARDSLIDRAADSGSAARDRVTSAGDMVSGALSKTPTLLAAAPLLTRFVQSSEPAEPKRAKQQDWREYPNQIGK